MHSKTRHHIANLASRHGHHYDDLVTAGAAPGITSLVYTAHLALATLRDADTLGIDAAAYADLQTREFVIRADHARTDEELLYAAAVADMFAGLAVRMGNIGEPLHEDEGADEEPLTVPEVWPAPTPTREPVPA